MNKIGFDAIGIDISEDMLNLARKEDPEGSYLLVSDSNLGRFENETFDLVLSAFTFDNIPTITMKESNFRELNRLLKPDGKIINLVSAPEIYLNEWASFSTKDFPENHKAKSGGKVRIIMTDVDDKRPVEDVLCTDDTYRNIYERTGFKIIELFKPLGNDSEPYEWINETKIAPWVIYLLAENK